MGTGVQRRGGDAGGEGCASWSMVSRRVHPPFPPPVVPGMLSPETLSLSFHAPPPFRRTALLSPLFPALVALDQAPGGLVAGLRLGNVFGGRGGLPL